LRDAWRAFRRASHTATPEAPTATTPSTLRASGMGPPVPAGVPASASGAGVSGAGVSGMHANPGTGGVAHAGSGILTSVSVVAGVPGVGVGTAGRGSVVTYDTDTDGSGVAVSVAVAVA